MHSKIKITLQVGLCLFLLIATPLNVIALEEDNTFPAVDLKGFHFSSTTSGWILLTNALYFTDNAGLSWTDITPPNDPGSEISTAFFIGDRIRVVLISPAGSADENGASYQLAASDDRGSHWMLHDLDLFLPDENWIFPESIHLFFMDAEIGWLVVEHGTGVNFSSGSLFGTQDGGLTWERLSIPVGAPVVFVTPTHGWTMGGASGDELYQTFDGGISWDPASSNSHAIPRVFRHNDFLTPSDSTITQLDIISDTAAWAQGSIGECHSDPQKTVISCSTTTRLLRTLDHGKTWQVIPLPSFPAGILETRTSFTNKAEINAASITSVGNTVITSGQGFDSCEITNLSQMQMWWDASPYSSVNLYIGGSSRACRNVNLTPSYLAQLERQGWNFIPTWVGPQAPCSSAPTRIPWDPGLAYFQGVEEANAALAVAEELGLTGADQSGTVIYYDLEAYNINDTDCLTASNNFIVGWTERMQVKGNIAGVYGSYNSGLVNIASHPTVVPDAVWIAHWIFENYESTASVWDAFRIPNDLWPDHQRLRQYTGGHNENWGGLVLNIDSNVLDGITAVRTNLPANDNFATATSVPYTPYADNRVIFSATNENDDPALPCTGSQGFQTLWYQVTPVESGVALVSTAGSSYDTVLAVWTGTGGNLASKGCNDDFNGLQSEIQFESVAGNPYYIEVISKNPDQTGSLFLTINMPASDEINGAQVVTSVPSSYLLDTTDAGDSNDDPAIPTCNLAPGKNSVWFSFTPTSSGPLSMDTLTSNYDTYLAVWSGRRGDLNLVGCNDDADGLQSRLETTLTAGISYYIEIGQYGGRLSPIEKMSDLQEKPASGGILNFHLTSFYDVPGNHWAWNWIERLYQSRITTGCAASPKLYCPENAVTRSQMALFLLRGLHGVGFIPPAPVGVFPDVPTTHWAAAWIEQLFLEGITAGCGGGLYCPEDSVTRAQMAVFLLRAKYGPGYIPPPASGMQFGDVPSTHWAAAWIEQLYFEGITTGCGSGNFCPEDPVKRSEMAVFLVRSFNLP